MPEARSFIAARAVESIKDAQSKENQCQLFSGSDEELLVILSQCIASHPAGIFMSEIPSVVM